MDDKNQKPNNNFNQSAYTPKQDPESPAEPTDQDLKTIDLTSADLESKSKNSKKTKKPKKPLTKKQKIIIIVVIVLVVLIAAAILCYFLFFKKSETEEPAIQPDPIYSVLTGEEIANESLNKTPTFCVQTPNGLDGARPQVGLSQAGVVFEAIAEAGITRFAAIYQNQDSSAIGPIRSLRPYYLEWDTPFDCTVVHAGGSDEALANVKSGGYRDLTESTVYMWRDYSAYVAPNNLFTSTALLNSFNNDNGYTTSTVKGFNRMTPAEAATKATSNYAAANPQPGETTSETANPTTPLVTNIAINFGSQPGFNTLYKYDTATNSYLRSYESGGAHLTYTCPANLETPKPQSDCGEPVQVAPKIVIAMYVDESLDSDGYHQRITTTGSGTAIIFQNGEAIKATWKKAHVADQIQFVDASGNEVKLGTGQTWIAAVPNGVGSVNY